MDYIVLIIGFALLVKGADFFVDGSSSVAKLLKIPPIIIGLTIVAFGTSMPEASVSINAAMQGKNDLAVSNVIGSNIFNLLVVLGCSALLKPITARWSVIKKEFPFSIVISLILFLFLSDLAFSDILAGKGVYTLGRIEGAILLALFFAFVCSAVKDALKSRNESDIDDEEFASMSSAKSAVYIVIGLVGIVLGGELVVRSASSIAMSFGLSQTFIGLTIVALGTSLPELVTSMVAAGKGENDLAVGNVVGSNIFNILLVLGLSAVISPISVDVTALYDTVISAVAGLFVYVCAFGQRSISRKEGVMFIVVYVLFFVYIFVRH